MTTVMPMSLRLVHRASAAVAEGAVPMWRLTNGRWKNFNPTQVQVVGRLDPGGVAGRDDFVFGQKDEERTDDPCGPIEEAYALVTFHVVRKA